MNVFRALCAELLNGIELDVAHVENPDRFQDLLARARAELAKPEPVGPTSDELRTMAAEFAARTPEDFALAVLARWGRPSITPILVSERLPGPEDCAPWPDEPDCDPWCWAARDIDGGWEWTQLGICHFSSHQGRRWCRAGYTHWLPHWFFPLPQPTTPTP